MAKRRALIVDDSRTAQIRLQKMLDRYDLEVETVFSAEEALGYLSYRQPSVVFLDHHMEGMDGLEALKIIKSNPNTALIPVIMYTSEKGDVYVGQARALGAMDIIGKGSMKHESLEKVLRSLGINPLSEATASKINELAEKATGDTGGTGFGRSYERGEFKSEDSRASNGNIAVDEVLQHVARLFDIHTNKVRQEIRSSANELLKRLPKGLSQKGRAGNVPPSSHDELETSEPIVLEPQSSSFSNVVLALILLGIAFLGYHLYINNGYQKIQGKQYDELISRLQNQERLVNSLISAGSSAGQPRRERAKNFAEKQVLLDSLSWAVNVNTQFAYGSKALTDENVHMVGELLALLSASNFEGQVYLDVHMGDYCVIQDLSGGWILPEPESNVEECRLKSEISEPPNVSEMVSLGFLNYVQRSPTLAEGDIFIEMASRGYEEPLASYPPKTSAVSAGQWNEVAQKNNRFAISFSAN